MKDERMNEIRILVSISTLGNMFHIHLTKIMILSLHIHLHIHVQFAIALLFLSIPTLIVSLRNVMFCSII